MTAVTDPAIPGLSLPTDDYTRYSGERMTFTFFISVVLHLVVILGIGFSIMKSQSIPPTLEVTLAQHESPDAPQQADYLAQYNQQASGTQAKPRQLTADNVADFADTEINHVEPLPKLQTTTLKAEPAQQLISTTRPQKEVSSTKLEEDHPEETIPIQSEEATEVELSTRISSLQAKLDRQRQQFAKQPRVRTLTSVATKNSADAEYLFKWQERVEMIGNLNYPDEARQKQLYGNLRLLVTVLPNGAVMKIDLLKSSGYDLLDQSAMRIVRMAAPYPPFPDELRKEADRLEIIRTWRFEKGDIFSSDNE
jgi:protein TonB